MFGFLSPHPHSDDYRRAYARLCVHQRQRLGIRSLPFHSYEAVFLYQLSLDAGSVDAECLPNHRCCKLSFRESVTGASDAEAGMFCVSFALLLASVKLDDDIRDSRSALARFARFVLKNRIEQAKRHLRKYDPHFDATVSGFVAEHHQLEEPDRAVRLEDYAEPTAKAFGYLFGLFANAIRKPEHFITFQAIGQHVGRAILSFDCAADWRRDRQRGEFNPLPDESAVERSLEFCWNQLSDIADVVRVHFGHRSRAATTASRVADRIARFQPAGLRTCAARAGKWSILKLVTERSWLALTTGQLAFAGIRASSGDGEKPTYVAAPPVEVPADEPGGWRRKTVDAMVPGERSATKPQDDCCGNTCLAGLCAEGSCDVCCCCLACA